MGWAGRALLPLLPVVTRRMGMAWVIVSGAQLHADAAQTGMKSASQVSPWEPDTAGRAQERVTAGDCRRGLVPWLVPWAVERREGKSLMAVLSSWNCLCTGPSLSRSRSRQ